MLQDNDSFSCADHRDNLVFNRDPYEVLSHLTPRDYDIWKERTTAWLATFLTYSITLSITFLLLGVISVVLLVRRNCIRLRVKTFFATYCALAILCFSRFLFLSLDPFGLVGHISEDFKQWLVISRLLNLPAFPSLVVCYTLVIATLLRMATGSILDNNRWYQKWQVVAVVTPLPYIIAIVAEAIANATSDLAIISIIICECFFVLWGATVCISYLFVGIKLINRIQRLRRNTVQRDGNFAHNAQANSTQQKTKQKIVRITYVSVVLGLVYTTARVVKLIYICVVAFVFCLGYDHKGDSDLWIAIHVVVHGLEVPLVIFILYAITDFAVLIKLCTVCFRHMLCIKIQE